MLRVVARTIQTYRQEELLVTRRRIRYWSLALFLIISADVLVLLQEPLAAGWLKIGGALIVSLVVLNTKLPDLRGALRFSISTIVAATLELLLFATGFLVLFAFSDQIIGYDPLLVSVALGVVLLLFFNPINRGIKKGVNRLFYGVERDYNQVLRAYSKEISNVLDLDLLSKVMVEVIGRWIDVDQGTLFTVDSDVDEEARRGYRLVGVQEQDGQKSPPIFIASDSSITQTLHEEKKPLTISEIEMLPKYHQVDGTVRNWFKRQKMDIFIPIFGMDEWIGVLALGPKTSGNSYTRSDFRLLETIADQTSVALQNARLVESIVRVNHEFRKAYAAMEVAHTKLERLDRTKSDFISIASHELRTPLTVLSGYSQMLLEDPKFVESDYYHKVIQGIGEGTSRLHEIVDNMLDIAKIDTRVLDLQAEPVSMGSLIHQVSIGFKEVISERNLDLTFENLEEVPPVVGDPEALKKVFYHLISNAIKYTPDYGAIKITASKLGDGDTRFPAGGVEVVVHDTGIGIDPRYQELIFTKFYQTGDVSLHSSGKTKFKGGGPGLGLAIVRGIVQAHGGRVWVESSGLDEENPPGSAFHVILPTEHQKY
jgi:signal transduction histidine kinase